MSGRNARAAAPAGGRPPPAKPASPPVPAASTPVACAFDDVPRGMIVRAFGVEYAHLEPPEGGDLYVTRLGWPDVGALLPARWYADQWYARNGVKLPGSTGHVYRVRIGAERGRAFDVVVKFSRMAQEVPIVVGSTFMDDVPPEVVAEARFNSPMEEFGLVMDLRRGAYGPPALRIRTQRPLAIYVPPEACDAWELGRSTSTFLTHRHLLSEDQDQAVKAIELDIRRIYVLLYGWIEGEDAEECLNAGRLADEDFRALTPRIVRELSDKGFRVLDTKPRHFILRVRRDGSVLRRHGTPAYGLVDYELLQRTPEHQRQFRAARREEYWRLQSGRPRPAIAAPVAGPAGMTVFGVDYAFGETPDGGRLWVVGRETGLFDYFLPDRWRRTPRIKLSAATEVYRTRTRDLVDVVYRRSRVGFRPRVDPLIPSGRRIREAGYNSPFEEFAIAERLREMGIATTYPRAIYRTGHETLKALRLRDPRRFADHATVLTPGPDPAPVLDPRYDYYSIWDTYRGLDPRTGDEGGGIGGIVGLERARDQGLITAAEAEEALRDARERLSHGPLPVESIADDEFVLCLDAAGVPRREPGRLALVLSLDALTAFEYGLLPEDAYQAVMARMEERLRAVDVEKLDPSGRHLLLTMDPDGRFRKDASGDLHAALCNFALIRGLYRPIR
jgi:hypothetical protein